MWFTHDVHFAPELTQSRKKGIGVCCVVELQVKRYIQWVIVSKAFFQASKLGTECAMRRVIIYGYLIPRSSRNGPARKVMVRVTQLQLPNMTELTGPPPPTLAR